MRAAAQLSVRCDHEAGCITCGDTAVAMRVIELQEDPTLALCATGDGEREVVETSLVGEAGEGAMVLVHAGVAIQRLDGEEPA